MNDLSNLNPLTLEKDFIWRDRRGTFHQVSKMETRHLFFVLRMMMTRKEAAKNIHSMREYERKVTASREAAVQALKKAGILTKTGEVAGPYKKLLGASS